MCRVLKPLTQLTSLNLTGNTFSGIPPCVSRPINLRSFAFSENHLQGPIALTYLDLQGCNLKFLPSSLKALPELQQLCLDGNWLTDLPDGIRWPKLHTLHIRGCCLDRAAKPSTAAHSWMSWTAKTTQYWCARYA